MPIREYCPFTGVQGKEVFDISFKDPRMEGFLKQYYKNRVKRDLLPERYTILANEEWGFYWQREIMDDEGMKALYEEWISPDESLAKKKLAPLKQNYREVQFVHRILKRLDKPVSQVRFVDIGMGWGGVCRAALTLGVPEVIGVEISPKRIAYAESHGITVVSDIANLDSKGFDVVFSRQCLEHVPAPSEHWAEYQRLMADGGRLCVAVPTLRGSVFCSEKLLAKGPLQPLEHINGFSPRCMKKLRFQSGLKLDLFATRWFQYNEFSMRK
jgi:SAM-dependent methyltransferase